MCQSKFDLMMLWGTSLGKIEGFSAVLWQARARRAMARLIRFKGTTQVMHNPVWAREGR